MSPNGGLGRTRLHERHPSVCAGAPLLALLLMVLMHGASMIKSRPKIVLDVSPALLTLASTAQKVDLMEY